ncbi:MAG: type II toxin-antitoxin system PemK/MazF family toxin [Cyclobacteriaceae bacterium]
MVEQYEIWIADLNPQIGTETGKTRPVMIAQTDLLNVIPHPSTLICPLTTKIRSDVEILRVHCSKGQANLDQASDIMIDQLRAIDNTRLIRKLGSLPKETVTHVESSIRILFDLD